MCSKVFRRLYYLLRIITEDKKKGTWVENIRIHNFKLETLKGRGGFGELCLGRSIILKWILSNMI